MKFQYNQLDQSFNIFTKFDKNPTHSKRDISRKYNHFIPLPQNSVPFKKKYEIKNHKLRHNDVKKSIFMKFGYNQSNSCSNSFIKFHQSPTHSNRDINLKSGIHAQTNTHRQIKFREATVSKT